VDSTPPALEVSGPGRFNIPEKWLTLSQPLAADCNAPGCTASHGFLAQRRHPLFVYKVCIHGNQKHHRHMEMRALGDSDHASSASTILFLQEHMPSSMQQHGAAAPQQTQLWNQQAFTVRCSFAHSARFCNMPESDWQAAGALVWRQVGRCMCRPEHKQASSVACCNAVPCLQACASGADPKRQTGSALAARDPCPDETFTSSAAVAFVRNPHSPAACYDVGLGSAQPEAGVAKLGLEVVARDVGGAPLLSSLPECVLACSSASCSTTDTAALHQPAGAARPACHCLLPAALLSTMPRVPLVCVAHNSLVLAVVQQAC
jgi:hypothetical protein